MQCLHTHTHTRRQAGRQAGKREVSLQTVTSTSVVNRSYLECCVSQQTDKQVRLINLIYRTAIGDSRFLNSEANFLEQVRSWSFSSV